MKTNRTLTIVLLIFLLASCGQMVKQIPTETSTPIPKTSPTFTFTSSPTFTPTFTPSPTQSPEIPVTISTQIPASQTIITKDNFNQIVQLASWGRGDYYQSEVSPDGDTFAVAASSGIYLYDIKTQEQKLHVTTPVSARSLAFSPIGNIIAIGEDGGAISILKFLGDGYTIHAIRDATYPPASKTDSNWTYYLAFSPDGQLLLASSYIDGTSIWDVNTGDLIFNLEHFLGITDSLKSEATFSPDSKSIVTSTETDIVYISLRDGIISKRISAPRASHIRFSPDGRFVAAVCNNKVFVWHESDDALIETFVGRNFVFSPNSKLLAIDNRDHSNPGDQNNVTHILILNEDASSFVSVATLVGVEPTFSPSSEYIALISVLRWNHSDIQIPEKILVYHIKDNRLIQTIHISDNSDNTNRLLNANEEWSISVLDSLWLPRFRMTFSHDDSSLLVTAPIIYGNPLVERSNGHTFKYIDKSTCGFHVLRNWQISDGSMISAISWEYPEALTAVAFSPDGNLIAYGGETKFPIYVRRISDGTLLHELSNNESLPINVLAFSSDSRYLYGQTFYTDEPIYWDLRTFNTVNGQPFVPDLSRFGGWSIGNDSRTSNGWLSYDGSLHAVIVTSGYSGLYFFGGPDSIFLRRLDDYSGNLWWGVAFSPDSITYKLSTLTTCQD